MNKENEELLHITKELDNIHYPFGTQYQRFHRYKALSHETKNDLVAIYNLVQSHSPGLRSKALLRYEKFLPTTKEVINKAPSLSAKKEIALKCPTNCVEENITTMLNQIKHMPKEWTLVHLTPRYNPMDNINEDNKVYQTNPIHIIVFDCGQNDNEPFLVTVDAPRDSIQGNCVELTQEMMSIIKDNKEALSSQKQRTFKNYNEKINYINKRQSIEGRLKMIVRDIENMWLREWRCLFSGKYVDESLEQQIKLEITTFLNTKFPEVEVTNRIISHLTYIVKGIPHLKLVEIVRAIKYCFPHIEDKNLIRDIAQFLRNLGDHLIKDVNKKKHPVILILDDSLDCFPWEMIDVLNGEPVSRVPSLQFLYTLFKEHEKDIVNGQKIISDFDKGAYIVNPDMDLKSMEIRLMNFFNYWTPNWTGTSGCKVDGEEFFELLTSSQIFSYNGHGSGSHLLCMDKIQRTRVKAVVLLFGCGSTKINRLDPQVEMYGPYHMYLIARCPCVVGMLWEVTDLDTDILSTEFMSRWIPSKAPIHWKYVDKTNWNVAEEELKFVKAKKLKIDETSSEPELLRALSSSKKVVSYYSTKYACVARGLPVRIQEKKNLPLLF